MIRGTPDDLLSLFGWLPNGGSKKWPEATTIILFIHPFCNYTSSFVPLPA
jgi:hypothetical protein